MVRGPETTTAHATGLASLKHPITAFLREPGGVVCVRNRRLRRARRFGAHKYYTIIIKNDNRFGYVTTRNGGCRSAIDFPGWNVVTRGGGWRAKIGIFLEASEFFFTLIITMYIVRRNQNIFIIAVIDF